MSNTTHAAPESKRGYTVILGTTIHDERVSIVNRGGGFGWNVELDGVKIGNTHESRDAASKAALEFTPEHRRTQDGRIAAATWTPVACRSLGDGWLKGAISVSDPAVAEAAELAEPGTWADVREGDVFLAVSPSPLLGPVNGFRMVRVERVIRRGRYGCTATFRYVGDTDGRSFNGTVEGNGESFHGWHRIARGLAPLEDGAREKIERTLEDARRYAALPTSSSGQQDYANRQVQGAEAGLARP